jgi:uncharacterized 2Fe-2S/4Fe-4S cluster protein (DUF4445 family)
LTSTCKIIFEPTGITIEAASNSSVPLRADCGGKGLCGKCRVIAEPPRSLSPLGEPELDILSPGELQRSFRLACQTRIQGDAIVTVPAQMAESGEARGKTGLTGFYPVDPMVERIVLPKGEPPGPEQGRSMDLAGWVVERVRSIADRDLRFYELEALRQLSLPAVSKGESTLVNHRQRGVTAVMAGSRPRSMGLAVDMGTTTLAAYLCDLQTGEVLTSAASVNPQRRYGEDVISRIAMADDQEDGLQRLNELVVDGINFLIARCVEQVGAGPDDIDEVTLVGNTTMERILVGFHPHGLGVSPYLPVFRPALDLKAADIGLKLNPGTNLFLFPVISGFVGGDTVGAILAERPHTRDAITLIVDIGTNGELVLGNRDGLWATSCATGPALEGAQIACGMRAVSGAIHKVDRDPVTGLPSCSVLGDSDRIPPIGICGSGLIDAMAVMRRIGVLLPSGRMKEGSGGVIADEKGIGREYVLVPADRSGTGRNISIMLKDVRQFQLAKSALSVGIELLMRNAGVDRVDRTVLTGAFGVRFNWRNAADIGMLPRPAVAGEVLSLDNLAGVGAIMALLDGKQREEAARVSGAIRFIELAMDPEFAVRFPMATAFPELNPKENG